VNKKEFNIDAVEKAIDTSPYPCILKEMSIPYAQQRLKMIVNRYFFILALWLSIDKRKLTKKANKVWLTQPLKAK
jgi:hypothetical protein